MSSSRGWSTPWKGLAWKRWSLDGGEVEIFSEVLRWIVDLKCYEIHRSWAHVFGSVFWRSWSEFKNQVWSLTPGRIWVAIKQKTTGGNISATATQQPTRNWLAHLERLGGGPWGCWQRAKVLQEKNQARLKNVGNVCVCAFFSEMALILIWIVKLPCFYIPVASHENILFDVLKIIVTFYYGIHRHWINLCGKCVCFFRKYSKKMMKQLNILLSSQFQYNRYVCHTVDGRNPVPPDLYETL